MDITTKTKYLFIDECGDPEFYGKGKRLLVDTIGFQPLLILGLIETNNRKTLQKAIIERKKEILNDTLFKTIPSVSEKDWFFHAKNDHPEVRAEFFKFIRNYEDIRFHAVIARKDVQRFARKHHANATEFYFDVIKNLLENQLDEDKKIVIYLAHKAKSTTERLIESIDKAIEAKQKKTGIIQKIDYTCTIEKSNFMPELSVVDYMLWALQRYIFKKESRFYEAIEHQVGSVTDLYDNQKLYDSHTNRFRLEQVLPFEWQ
ncbi:MAG: DUF3800 domain-containing protein [Emticicia sp.]|nr:DUF3800 domain-containing protein [Emticicia sp.]